MKENVVVLIVSLIFIVIGAINIWNSDYYEQDKDAVYTRPIFSWMIAISGVIAFIISAISLL